MIVDFTLKIQSFQFFTNNQKLSSKFSKWRLLKKASEYCKDMLTSGLFTAVCEAGIT